MAILLIFDHDKYHPDPEKSQRACFRRGDVVEVFDDDKPCVIPPAAPWLIVMAKGLSVENAKRLMKPAIDTKIFDTSFRAKTRAREFVVPVDDLPKKIADELAKRRYVEVDWSEIHRHVTSKVTGETLADTLR